MNRQGLRGMDAEKTRDFIDFYENSCYYFNGLLGPFTKRVRRPQGGGQTMIFKCLRRLVLALSGAIMLLSGCAVTYHPAPPRATTETPDVAGVIAPDIRVQGDPRIYRWREVELGRRWELRTSVLSMEATFLAGTLLLSRTHPCPRGSQESVESLHFVAGDAVGSRRTCEGARVEADVRWFRTTEFTHTLHPNLRTAFESTVRKRAEPRIPPPREGERRPTRPAERGEQRSSADLIDQST